MVELRSPIRLAGACVLLVAGLLLPAGTALSADRTLSLEERIAARETLERIYQRHRMEPSRQVELPAAAVEGRVQDTLRRSAALDRFWNSPITADALGRELDRILRDTLFPGRLQEMFDALDRDPVLIQETLVRRALVQRLTRNFFAGDPRIHESARREAEGARRWMLRGRLQPDEMQDRWGEIEIERRTPRSRVDGSVLALDAADFERWLSRAPAVPGEIGPVVEEHDGFTIRVLLENRDDSARIGIYRVPKRAWDDWWNEVAPTLDSHPVPTVARAVSLTEGTTTGSGQPEPACLPDQLWNNGVLDDIPEPRLNHTAVWTGTEMIVWGGTGILPVLQTGGRYDPLLDTWAPTSLVNAPGGRTRHTAAWTGTEMIVWGGLGGVELADGGRYDPTTDTWLPMTGVGAPEPRVDHSMVWTGSEAIVWSGQRDGSGIVNGGRYSPDTDSWLPTSVTGVPLPRTGHVALWTGDRMLVWGGSAPGPANTGGRYDPATDTWAAISTTNAPGNRTGHRAVWTGTEMIVWGGQQFLTPLDSGGRYNPTTDTWVATTRIGAPAARRDPSAVWTGDRMIIWGGSSGNTLRSGGSYNPVTNSWTTLTTAGAPGARSLHSGIWTGQLMVVWGGAQNPGLNTSGGRYDPVSGSWTPTATPNGQTGRRNHTALWTGSEMLVWGGYDTLPPNYLDTGGRYDPTIDMWVDTATVGAPSPRELHHAVWTGSEMIVWGGFDGVSHVGDGARSSPLSDSWAPVPATGAASARQHPSVTWTGKEMVVWGGFQGEFPFNSGARYDPLANSWSPMATFRAPGRFLHSAIWTGSELIVWGGTTVFSVAFDGGRYDPLTDSWSALSFLGVPTPRNRHSAVWTGEKMMIWGGFDGFTYHDDGGQYDPASDTWSPITSFQAPGGRLDHTAVWTGDLMLVWGGFDASAFPYLGSGGRYDPVSDAWQEITLSSAPSPRNDHTAVWIGEWMIIWGGSDGSVLNTGGRYAVGDLPSEVAGLAFRADTSTLDWVPLPGAGVTHDLLRGNLGEFPVGAGPGEVCVATGLGGSGNDLTVPPLGTGHWYLSRGVNECGSGSLGQSSSAVPRSSSACP